MGAPTAGTQNNAGTALHAGQPAVVSWTNHSTAEALYVHLGFEPSVVHIWDETSTNFFIWVNTFTDADVAEVTATAAHTESNGVTPFTGTVPATAGADSYIRNNTVSTSTAANGDQITGVLLGTSAVGGTGAVMHMVAWP